MQFKRIAIPYKGRDKYGSTGDGSVRTISSKYSGVSYSGGGGSSTTDGGSYGGGVNNTSFFCILSKNSNTYSAVDLAQGTITDSINIIGYRGDTQAQTWVGNISNSASTNNFDISGLPESGMVVNIVGNGSTGATLNIGVSSTISADSGELTIPIAVNISDDSLDPYHKFWYENQEKCRQLYLKFSWTINRASASNYILDLTNQAALVNCDSAGTLYSSSIALLQCTAVTWYNGTVAEGITYSASTESAYAAQGYSINSSTGVLSFVSSGSGKLYFNHLYAALPINIIAYKNGEPIATKQMVINRNYPGVDGTPATSRWIVTDANAIVYNPNTSAYTPNRVIGRVMKQVGDASPVYDSSATIYKWYDDIVESGTSAQGSITGNTYDGISSITFALKNDDNEYYEQEEVPVIPGGTNGQPGGQGDPGPSGESAWYLTLSNDNASINADADGNILPGAVRPTCKAKLYYGTNRQTSATYSVNYGGASGVTSSVTSGILTLTFGSNFNFTGSTVSITISGKTASNTRDTKIMNITKSIAGEAGDTPYIGSNGNWWIGNTDTGIQAEANDGDTPYIGGNGNWWIGNTDTGVKAEGTDAVSYWLQPSFGEVIYDPNTNTPNPTAITCAAYKQVGQDAVVSASDATIKYQWQNRSTGSFTTEQTYSTAITITSGDCTTYKRLRFTLYVGASQVDQEDVDIMVDGLDGSPGAQGRKGAAIRGPYLWEEQTGSTRDWCNGETSSTISNSEKWIDVIFKDGIYYYCSTAYNGGVYPWASYSSNWTSGETMDFVAANLILASGASIDFLTGNEIYLRNSNNEITAGAAGGNGINFWAGAEDPANAEFTVNYDGEMTATKGTFGCMTIESNSDMGTASLHAEETTSAAGNVETIISQRGAYFHCDGTGEEYGHGQNVEVKILPAETGFGTDYSKSPLDITGCSGTTGLYTDGHISAEDGFVTELDTTEGIGYASRFNYAVMSPFKLDIIPVTDTASNFSSGTTSAGNHWLFTGIDTQCPYDSSYSTPLKAGIDYTPSGMPSWMYGHWIVRSGLEGWYWTGVASTSATKQDGKIYITL